MNSQPFAARSAKSRTQTRIPGFQLEILHCPLIPTSVILTSSFKGAVRLMRCYENQPEFTADLRHSCVRLFEIVLVEIVNVGKTETKTMFRFAPSLGDNFGMQFI